MKSKFIEEDKLLVLEITEEIDHHTTEELRRKMDDEIERCMPRKVIFDFGSVSFMDSAGIGMVIGRYKLAKMFGASVSMTNVRKSVKKIFEMCGILRLIPIIEEKIG